MPSFGPASSTDAYVQVGGNASFISGTLTVANASVLVILQHAPPGQLQLATSDEPVLISPATGASVPLIGNPYDLITGFQIKSAVVGTPAVYSGSLIPFNKAGIGGGTAFSGTLAAGGGFTPPATGNVIVQHNGVVVGTEPTIDLIDAGANVLVVVDNPGSSRVEVTPPKFLTGIMNSAGGTVAGTGWSAVRNSLGNYTITYSVAFGAAPLVVFQPNAGDNARFINIVSSVAGSVNFIVRDSALTLQDTTVNFFAIAVA